jgi:hypothetical protein
MNAEDAVAVEEEKGHVAEEGTAVTEGIADTEVGKDSGTREVEEEINDAEEEMDDAAVQARCRCTSRQMVMDGTDDRGDMNMWALFEGDDMADA